MGIQISITDQSLLDDNAKLLQENKKLKDAIKFLERLVDTRNKEIEKLKEDMRLTAMISTLPPW